MMRGNMGRRRPVTLDDMLVLLGRRLLLPLAISVAIVTVPFFIVIGGLEDLAGFGGEVLSVLMMISAVIGAGLIFVGVPAAYIVASRRLGYRRSLIILAAIGFAAPFLPLAALVGATGGGFVGLGAGVIAGLVGILVSVVWTVSNSDLFRTENVA
jgi:hypothetical protein